MRGIMYREWNTQTHIIQHIPLIVSGVYFSLRQSFGEGIRHLRLQKKMLMVL